MSQIKEVLANLEPVGQELDKIIDSHINIVSEKIDILEGDDSIEVFAAKYWDALKKEAMILDEFLKQLKSIEKYIKHTHHEAKKQQKNYPVPIELIANESKLLEAIKKCVAHEHKRIAKEGKSVMHRKHKPVKLKKILVKEWTTEFEEIQTLEKESQITAELQKIIETYQQFSTLKQSSYESTEISTVIQILKDDSDFTGDSSATLKKLLLAIVALGVITNLLKHHFTRGTVLQATKDEATKLQSA